MSASLNSASEVYTEGKRPGEGMRQLSHTWELLLMLTLRELKLRYQDTALGFLWTLLKPLLLGLALYVALRGIMQIRNVPDYHIFMLSALFPWAWFQNSVVLCSPTFVNNASLLKKVHFPRFVLPMATVLNNMAHFFLSIPIIILLLVVAGHAPEPTWLLGIPILAALQLLLTTGLVLIVASLDVFFRDLEHLVEVTLNLLFWVTPIIYSADNVPAKYKPIFLINPMSSLIEAWRNLFQKNQLPTLDIWPVILSTVVALVLGITIFRLLESHFEDAL